MEYIEICKYVFKHEIVDWELRAYRSKKRQLSQARQISMYLGDWFNPEIKDYELTEPFNLKRGSAISSVKAVKDRLFSDKSFRAKMDRYLLRVREMIDAEAKQIAENEVFMEPDYFNN